MTDDTRSPGPIVAPMVETLIKAPPAPVAPTEESMRRLRLLPISLLALSVGIITGFGAVVFRGLIGLIHNLCFLGQFRSRTIPASSHHLTPGARRLSSFP